MKGEIDEAMSLFLRKGDEIGEQNGAIRQPPAPEPDGEQFLFFRRRHRGKLSTVSGFKTNLSLARNQTGSM
jgi:hypothetical protein